VTAAAGERSLVRRLAPDDLPGLVDLQRAVAEDAPPGFLFGKTAAQLAARLDGSAGAAYGIQHGASLVAAALLALPAPGRANGEPRMQVVPPEDWALRACFLENSMVLPAARGRGYQRVLVDARFAHAAAAGMRWVCAGIALDNVASWRNLLASGFVVADVRLDFGYPLIALVRSIEPGALASDPRERREVAVGDAVGHEAALRAGFVGVRLASGVLVYERRLPT